jgi:hypothetical protein
MKKILLVSFILFWLTATINAGDTAQLSTTRFKTDTIPTAELTNFLQQMNIPSFYGKPVDSFLLAVNATPYDMKIYGGDHSQGAMFRASYLWYRYSGGPILRIYVREYTHMNRHSTTGTWDISLFRKEKIYKIEVWKNQNVCINGSCLE